MNATAPYIEINGRKIGTGFPTYIVAEMSANHNQEFKQAVEIMRAAKDSGSDAIKLQTFTADSHTIQSDKKYFHIEGGTPWDGSTLYDLYQRAYMPWEWQPKLKEIAEELGLDLFSAAVDEKSVKFLEKMNVPVHKAASFELVDLPLIEKMARTGKPVILSTGMATLSEIEEAVQAARRAGSTQILLLKCTSTYPSPPEEMNLVTIPHMSQAFHAPVGLSDHTLGIAVPIAAVSLGACMVEKHFTLSRSVPSLDSSFSLEPHEFKAMVESIRIVEKAIGEVHYGVSEIEAKNRVFRRSLFVVKNMKKGEAFTAENVRSIRPGYGLPVCHYEDVIGCFAACNIERGTPLSWNLIGGSKSDISRS